MALRAHPQLVQQDSLRQKVVIIVDELPCQLQVLQPVLGVLKLMLGCQHRQPDQAVAVAGVYFEDGLVLGVCFLPLLPLFM